MDLARQLSNPAFFPHRYVEGQDAILFLPIDRNLHRQCTFATDEYLPKSLQKTMIAVNDLTAIGTTGGPIHFIFHSAYCCSTMLARAFDIPGLSMGLKEPQILNDMLGWMRRGASQQTVLPRLQMALNLLSRPYGESEAVIVKPSNLINPLSMMMLSLRPESRAILLYAPLDDYLRSIAKKQMWGRLWVRELLNGRIVDQTVVGGLSTPELMGLTDLQVAALGWLSDLRLFQELQRRFDKDRIMAIDSRTLLDDKINALQRSMDHFRLPRNPEAIAAIIDGPAFLNDSKDGSAFSMQTRNREYERAFETHGDEITMVMAWTKAMAEHVGIAMALH
jgi:hypothetical protein